MYTRYHPIVTAFQKTILLKSSKSTSFSCSDSTLIFSQFKHPLRRYFSGGSSNRYSRQDVPAIFPNKGANNEIQRWQIMYPHKERMSVPKIDYMNGSPRQYQFRHTPGTTKFPLSQSYVNRDSIAENKKPSGTITIIIDKADVVVGDNPNENITIRVTNTPQISSKRLIERLSDPEVTEMCSARCNCCQQCVQLRRNISSQSVNVRNLPVRNISMVTPRMPHNPPVGTIPNPYIPARNFSIEGFSTVENNAKNRHLENFPKMRKMILPNNVVEQQARPKMEQKPPLESIHKQHNISTHRGFSQVRAIPLENARQGQQHEQIIRKSQDNQMQRQPHPSKNSFMQNPKGMEKTISESKKRFPLHPTNFVQNEKAARNIKGLAIEKSRQAEKNVLPNRTMAQRPSRNLVQPIQLPAMFRSSPINRGFPQHRLPMVQSLRTNSILQNVLNKNRSVTNVIPFNGGGMERKSLSLDFAGNRFRSNNIRRSLSAHNQNTQNTTFQLDNQKNRGFLPRPTNLKVVPNDPVGKKTSFVNQEVVPFRNRFPNENHNHSRIPKMISLRNHAAKAPPIKLQVASADSATLQRRQISLGSVSQTTSIRHNMAGNKNFKNQTTNHQSTVISKQNRYPSRFGNSMGLATQTQNIHQRNMPMNRNVNNLISKQPPNNRKQMRPGPPLHRLKSSFGTVPQVKNIQGNVPIKNVQNLPTKIPSNSYKQMRPAPPLHRLGSLQINNVFQPNSSLNRNLQNSTNRQPQNDFKQIRPNLPMHRLGTSAGPVPQDILKRSFPLNKKLQNLTSKQQSINNSHKQFRPTPPLHRLGTSFGSAPQTNSRHLTNQQPPNGLKQNRSAEPQMSLGSASQLRKVPQRNLPFNKNHQILKSQLPPNNLKQMRPTPPFHRFGSIQTKTVQKNMSINANLNNSISRRPSDSKQVRQPPPVHRFGISFGSGPQANILQRNMPLRNAKSDQQTINNSRLRPAPPLHRLGGKNILQKSKTFITMQNLANKRPPSNFKEFRPATPRGTSIGPASRTNIPRNVATISNSLIKNPLNKSKQMCPTPQLRTSLGPPNRINVQKNMIPNKYTENLPHQQYPPNLKIVRSAPPMQNLGSSLTSPKIQNFVQPQRDGSQLLPPPRPIFQPVQNRDCYLQSSLPIQLINEPKASIKYYGRPKFQLNTFKAPNNRDPVKGLNNENKFKPIPLWKKRKIQAMPKKIIEKTQQNPLMPFQKMMLRSQLRTKVPKQQNNMKEIPIKEQSMVSSTKTSSPNENVVSAGNGNSAVLLCGPQNLKLINNTVPILTDDKGVIIKMLYVHLTDMDAQMYASGRDGLTKLTKPTIAGKTGCGVIVDVGKKVENLKTGDKVFVKPVSCGECSSCKNGNLSLCNRISVGEKLGLLTQLHAHPAEFVTKLPDNVNLIDSSMIGELSSAISACKRSSITAGDNVMVIEGSSLGLRVALTAKSMGATSVCLADTRKLVLEQAKKLGIDRVFLINPKLPTSYTSISMYEYFGGENPRIVFNCNGSEQTNYLAIHAVKLGGKVVLMKNDRSDQTILISDAINRDVDILTSQYSDSESELAALKFLSAGKVPLNGVNTQIFDLSDIHEAFQFLLAPKGTTNNIFVRCNRFDETYDTKKNSDSS